MLKRMGVDWMALMAPEEGEGADAGGSDGAEEVTAPAKVTVEVEDAGNARRSKPAARADEDEDDEGEDADESADDPAELKRQLKAAREKARSAENRVKSLTRKLTPLEQAEADRKKREEDEAPIKDKLSAREKELKAAREKAERLETRVRNGDLERQLRRAGYGEDEIDDIVELAQPDEVDYDEDKGRYSLDVSRFVARKSRYDLSKRPDPAEADAPEKSEPAKPLQRTPNAASTRPKNYTEDQLAGMSKEEYEKHRGEILAASRNGQIKPR